MATDFQREPWEHPEWYDLHDNTYTAGPEREPEHYREFVITLPPLDRHDHLVDVGTGTGKLTQLIAQSYGQLGQVTLVDPNALKLERAAAQLRKVLPQAKITTVALGLGVNAPLPTVEANLGIIGSVLMPIMTMRGGTLTDGLGWLRRVLQEAYGLLTPGSWLYDLETLAAPWDHSRLSDPVRRLRLPELLEEFWRAGFSEVECMYRFRDRVVVRGHKARSPIAELNHGTSQ